MKIENASDSIGLLPAGWMQLTTEKQSKATVVIEIGGCHINVDKDTDPERLKQVCLVLRSL